MCKWMRGLMLAAIAIMAMANQADAQDYCVGVKNTVISGPAVQNDTKVITGTGQSGITNLTRTGGPTPWPQAWADANCFGIYAVDVGVWVEGRQPPPAGSHVCGNYIGNTSEVEQQYNVCYAFLNKVNSGPHGLLGDSSGSVQVSMVYMSQTYLDGTWGVTSQHLYNNTYRSGHAVVSYNVTLAAVCEQQGYPWHWEEGVGCTDNYASPILLPMRGEVNHAWSDFKLTAPKPAIFDIDGDGAKDTLGWVAPGSNLGFLWLDRNHNGVVDNGTELFGDAMLPGVTNGFRALAQIAPQGEDGRLNAIDSNDPIYKDLLLWEDRNADGFSQQNEIRPLSEVYASIGLGFIRLPNQKDQYGNNLGMQGWAEQRTSPGLNRAKSQKEHETRTRTIIDVFFVKQ